MNGSTEIEYKVGLRIFTEQKFQMVQQYIILDVNEHHFSLNYNIYSAYC